MTILYLHPDPSQPYRGFANPSTRCWALRPLLRSPLGVSRVTPPIAPALGVFQIPCGRRFPRKKPNNLRLFDYFTQKNEMTITFSFGTFFSETIVPKSKSLSQVKNVFRTNVVHSLLQNSPVSTINVDNKIALKTVSKFQLPNFFFEGSDRKSLKTFKRHYPHKNLLTVMEKARVSKIYFTYFLLAEKNPEILL